MRKDNTVMWIRSRKYRGVEDKGLASGINM